MHICVTMTLLPYSARQALLKHILAYPYMLIIGAPTSIVLDLNFALYSRIQFYAGIAVEPISVVCCELVRLRSQPFCLRGVLSSS